MPHAETRTTTTSPQTRTTTPTPGDGFEQLLQQLIEQIGQTQPLDPANIFSQLEEGGGFIQTLSNALAGAFQPFVQSQLQGVADTFRTSGNEGALRDTGRPNRLTQSALPNALARINQQFGGQFTNLVSSIFGDLTQANAAQQQGQFGIIDSLAKALGLIPKGKQTTIEGGDKFSQLFNGGGGGGRGSGSTGTPGIFQGGTGGGQLKPKPQFDPFRLQNTPGSPFFIRRGPEPSPFGR